ncbi:MAG TPA: cell division protein ZapD [Gammaproteobacteria bacterium]|nr:cell division protein ZapD [Gammaproteobacteria bacterium]
MQIKIIYEQPLNERIRTFLRLEHLFKITNHHIKGNSEWDSRAAITNLLSIVELLGRSDIKSDLVKELERHASTLNSLANNPNVDLQRLENILGNINSVLESIRKPAYQPGQSMKQDELISSIKQRITIPGGSCNFDLPNYHHWLHKAEENRTKDLEYWYNDLKLINDGLKLSLNMIRNSANPTRERAPAGFYQKPMESNLSCQLIRIVLPIESSYYPEISGGKHRFTVRFMEQQNTGTRPVQAQEDIEFELHCCIL